MQPLAAISPLVPLILLFATVLIFLRIPLVKQLLILPYKALYWLVTPSALFKKNQNWSVVYDAKTKLPIDPAYIIVRNTLGVEVSTMISDLNGRFTLILPRGLYTIDVQKTNYAFPAFSLHSARTDGPYTGLYYGETIEVVDSERSIAIAIPMDPIAKDWNQSEKRRHHIFLHFIKESEFDIAEIVYLLIGAFFLIVHCYYHYNETFYGGLGIAYVAVALAILFWYIFEPKHYSQSIVIDRKTKQPVAFARITVFTAKDVQILQKITSFEGQFTCLVPKGKYYITIERREDDGSYVLAHTSSIFHVYNGTIDRRFML